MDNDLCVDTNPRSPSYDRTVQLLAPTSLQVAQARAAPVVVMDPKTGRTYVTHVRHLRPPGQGRLLPTRRPTTFVGNPKRPFF